jgi:hypothetical protein
MAFQKGNDPRRGKGGTRKGAGRPTTEKQKEKKASELIARDMLEKEVTPVMTEYIRLAKGGAAKRNASPAVIKHAVDKYLPPTQKIWHNGAITFVTNVPEDED